MFFFKIKSNEWQINQLKKYSAYKIEDEILAVTKELAEIAILKHIFRKMSMGKK